MRFLLVTLVAVFPFAAFSHTGLPPVPANWFRDGRLIVPEWNLSLLSPTATSRWFREELPSLAGTNASALVVEVSPDEKYTAVVSSGGSPMESPSMMPYFEALEKNLIGDWQSIDTQVRSAVLPTTRVARFQSRLVLPGNSILYGYGYLVPGRPRLTFVIFSTHSTEPPGFTRFVSSFSRIDPDAASLPGSLRPLAWFLVSAGGVLACLMTVRLGYHRPIRATPARPV